MDGERSKWLEEMMSERARQYAEVHDQEVQTLLARHGLEWHDGRIGSLRDLLERNGYELIMEQQDVSAGLTRTNKRYSLKLCKVIDVENYTIAFHIKNPEGEKES